MPPISEPLALPPYPQRLLAEQQPANFCARFFPIHLPCCPCLGPSWTKVQDWLHMNLLVGVACTLICVVQVVFQVATSECQSPACWKELLSAILILPTTVYFIRTISTYDEQLQRRMERCEEEEQSLIRAYEDANKEMQETAKNLRDTANDFALGRFNDFRRNFKTFLEKIVRAHGDLYVDEQMLEELRVFVYNWMEVYSNILLNPSSNPMMLRLRDTLAQCRTASEICEEAVRRLNESRVVFQFEDASTAYNAGEHSVTSSSVFDEEASAVPTASSQRSIFFTPGGKCGVTWFSLGRCQMCRRETLGQRSRVLGNESDRFPVTYYFCCVVVRVLSSQHASLIAAFWIDIGLLLYELCNHRFWTFCLVAWNEVCVVSMLACFEQINEIAKIERRINVCRQRHDDVLDRQQQVNVQWQQVQQLHDLWKFRTMPTLAILDKIHSKLAIEDACIGKRTVDGRTTIDSGQRLEFLKRANESVMSMQMKLGATYDWSSHGRLPLEWKESVGQKFKDFEHMEDVDQLVQCLPLITNPLALEVSMEGSRSAAGSPQPSPRQGRPSSSALGSSRRKP